MARRQSKSQPTWTEIKSRLASFDRAQLLDLVRDLYGAHKDNQTFLHARLGVGEDTLKPYKETIERWVAPDVFRHQDTSVVKAKQAISNYRKAVGDPAGLAELMVFYCERAAGFYREYGNDVESEYAALVRMFEQALAVVSTLAAGVQDALLARLNKVSDIGENFGYGVGEAMDFYLGTYIKDED